MTHRLALRDETMALVTNLLRALGITWYFLQGTGPGRMGGAALTALQRPDMRTGIVLTASINDEGYYACEAWYNGVELTPHRLTVEQDGVEAILAVIRWFGNILYGERLAEILTASLMVAIRAEVWRDHCTTQKVGIDDDVATDILRHAVKVFDTDPDPS